MLFKYLKLEENYIPFILRYTFFTAYSQIVFIADATVYLAVIFSLVVHKKIVHPAIKGLP